jgi:ubiquinone/menaquinone biosynthesis C-methylase UbiE
MTTVLPSIRRPSLKIVNTPHIMELIQMESQRNRVCPVELADSLDSKIRRWLQDPLDILTPYVRRGMTALDVGCGPGFFSIELAKLVGDTGRVIAVDLQQGMLDKLHGKIAGSPFAERIQLVKCEQNSIVVSEAVDFILTFYMVHEVREKENFFRQLANLLKNQGQYLLVEPKLFHVSRKQFQTTLTIAQHNGFDIHEGPRLLASWSGLLTKTLR